MPLRMTMGDALGDFADALRGTHRRSAVFLDNQSHDLKTLLLCGKNRYFNVFAAKKRIAGAECYTRAPDEYLIRRQQHFRHAPPRVRRRSSPAQSPKPVPQYSRSSLCA